MARSWLTTALSPRIVLLCPVEAYPSLNVRGGALRRQNRVLIWIDGHIPSRVIDFFLTDWMHGHRIGYIRVSSFDPVLTGLIPTAR